MTNGFETSRDGYVDQQMIEEYLLAKQHDYLPLPLIEELPEDYEPPLSHHEIEHADHCVRAASP